MSIRNFAMGLSIALLAAAAAAQERPPYGPDVSLEQAKKIAAGAAEESRKSGWRMAIAIVDNHGFLVYFERMEDSQTSAVHLAIEKARTAAAGLKAAGY
ncbi:MAG TPA: heme-binding protein [Burkholderiales bacterium]|nr:heme-binding protein [Burkholderiales bacterium]